MEGKEAKGRQDNDVQYYDRLIYKQQNKIYFH